MTVAPHLLPLLSSSLLIAAIADGLPRLLTEATSVEPAVDASAEERRVALTCKGVCARSRGSLSWNIAVDVLEKGFCYC